ncbi:UDP-galactopyranose mutase [Comamonas endophytica]|uniref:UDP-galactopyranose mutase n=1 Tax=Comamonas endophytica TaxID=2949090 RepID=A0ABY6GH69_9BURK|nr:MULTISPECIES: UDP-galactopyranose mutase [unclassified Acidovorax]MCD2514376.1 UDP-galactopyranose mutase [Acidovorax sp. D4N7]UYG53617.1 UDP-galactopyranose mutase [Acidovorax sp. 5MLIR]UYG53665.1 UDP-galactopyranose mutase [Acidovorax sp. 5MLIR]
MAHIAIVGAGFSGAVLAQELGRAGHQVEVFDTRAHVAGNCHTARDDKTGVMLHTYGPHIFHTSNQRVWDYIQQFGTFVPFINRVKAITGGRVYSLPLNLLTINQFLGRTFSPAQAKAFFDEIAQQGGAEPANFEEQALSLMGRDLYEAFFKNYTIKQWGMSPTQLPASILKRLPMRFNYDDNYYASQYQGIPRDGYTAIVENLLDLPNVTLQLGTRFERSLASGYDHVFCSGPIDAWFGCDEGRLGYRTLDFVREDHTGDYQGNAVINYCDLSVPWTRISEHKHFAPWEQHADTVIFKEYSRLCEENDTPYYPIRLVAEKALLAQYVQRAQLERNVTFVGRLGTYRYIDMHVTIAEALDVAEQYQQSLASGKPLGSFVMDPLG